MRAYIELNGRGGEIVISSLSDDAYEYWIKQSEDKLSDYILNNASFEDVPSFADFIKDENGDIKQWFDLDDRGHYFGAHPKHCNLRVEIEIDGARKTVMDTDFSTAISKTKSKIKTSSFSKDLKSRRPSLIIFSYEKGCFFESDFDISGKEDFKNLVFNAVTIYSSETLIHRLTKDELEIDNIGGDTTGKGIFFQLAKI